MSPEGRPSIKTPEYFSLLNILCKRNGIPVRGSYLKNYKTFPGNVWTVRLTSTEGTTTIDENISAPNAAAAILQALKDGILTELIGMPKCYDLISHRRNNMLNEGAFEAAYINKYFLQKP